MRSGSVDRYQQRLGRLGPLVELAIGDVTSQQVADWQTWLLSTPRADGRVLAPKTVSDTRSTVRQLFAAAVDFGLTRSNPVDRVKLPRVAQSPGRVLSLDKAARLITETDRHRYGAAVCPDSDCTNSAPTFFHRRMLTYAMALGSGFGRDLGERVAGDLHLQMG